MGPLELKCTLLLLELFQQSYGLFNFDNRLLYFPLEQRGWVQELVSLESVNVYD